MYRNSPRSLAEGSTFEQRTLETDRGRASRQPTITVVVPAKNEADNLRAVLPTLPPVHEVILVDGNSTDGTVEVARQVMPDIKIVKQTRKGKGNALACGFKAATGDIIVMFDADGSADAREIPAYVDALINGADFAKGSRFIKGGGSDDITLLRHVGATGLHVLVNLTFGQRFSDLCYGYNAFWTELVPALGLPDIDAPVPPGGMIWGDGFEIETVINLRMVGAGVQIREVPSIERPRIHGESNLRTFKDGFRVLRTIVSERQRATALRRRGATVLTTTTAPAEQVRRPSISA
ncbi:glycosyltransferase family 2 protein [Allobranchiibius huperziae]|uniref:Glycosyltransferase involved in cell wall biosynthesis n=1 Tax=Allobranchiibius huperziae TaxID=1874116 RepID=A0A853DHS9_9MICO|nr:glycosyltransferase family 2 protein [Allobranchiibius huperziae]NYJ76237.1 glycosyltransferase involved in cell wall biosynthesis [Allobranchiibius huperziae]